MERNFHTATLIGKKIFFLGGQTKYKDLTNDFFYLDISKQFDKTKGTLPLVNLNDRALEIPPHYGAATSVFGALKDSIFFFSGDIGKSNVPSTLLYSFNTTQSEWNVVTNSQGMIPDRRRYLCAIADNNDKIYLFGGEFTIQTSLKTISNEINIFDTNINNWNVGKNGLFGRKGYTATFLPNTKEIIYIGGYGENNFIDITYLDVYNTTGDTWRQIKTTNPPESRYLHTAVLTSDSRIVIFGGAGSIQTGLPYLISADTPVQNYYVVLNLNTSEWYNGTKIPFNRAPYRGHTATLVNGYMFIAFGSIYSTSKKFNNDILIYKIEDYANFTEVNTIYPEVLIHKNPKNNFVAIVIGAILGGTSVVAVLLGFVGFKYHKQATKYSGERPPFSLIPTP